MKAIISTNNNKGVKYTNLRAAVSMFSALIVVRLENGYHIADEGRAKNSRAVLLCKKGRKDVNLELYLTA